MVELVLILGGKCYEPKLYYGDMETNLRFEKQYGKLEIYRRPRDI
ncbi:MAG: hypothetical protein QXI71_04220 [Candidatus Bathyarchaeia archaeon]